MRRLTYSPKAFAFIRAANLDYQIIDVTDFIVSGSVTRLVNQPSKASLVLKNKDFWLTLGGKNDDRQIFSPMDAITIWLQRVKGRPVQVFTGYLDSVPYYQMYPGNAQITATCTLKRLQHIYFDSSTSATQGWFQSHGWVVDLAQGKLINFDNLTNESEDPFKAGWEFDGGFGSLLRDFMMNFANWPSDQMVIGDLPPSVPKTFMRIYKGVEEEERLIKKHGEKLFGKLLSIKTASNPESNGPNALKQDAIKAISSAVKNTKVVDKETLVLASVILTGLDPGHSISDKEDPEYGVGLFSIALSTDAQGVLRGHDRTTGDLLNPLINTNLFINRLKASWSIGRPGPKSAPNAFDYPKFNADADVLGDWIARAANKERYSSAIVSSVKANRDSIPQLITSLDTPTNSSEFTGSYQSLSDLVGEVLPNVVTLNDVLGSDSNDEKYKDLKINKVFPYYLWIAQRYKKGSPLELGSFPTASLIKLDSTDEEASRTFADWAGKQDTKLVYYIGKDNQYIWYENGKERARGKLTTDNPQLPSILSTQDIINGKGRTVYLQALSNSKKPTWVGEQVTKLASQATTTDPNTDSSQVSFRNLARLASNAAFVTAVNFPVDVAGAMLLHGSKALMNDRPVIDMVEELCGASLRNWMSLPDGRFVAFFPDYFGSFGRSAYWYVDDLEIVNFGIQLTDEPLATHVFVTGNTQSSGFDNSISDIIKKVFSYGVVNVGTMFGSDDNFIAGKNKGPIIDQGDAFEFITRFGTRPMVKDMPMIRSPWFELLYAYQLFMYQWAAQFATTVEFTFQPEVFPGSRIGFIQRNIEVYVESVTHSWDYEGGFSTTAVVQAPSTTTPDKYPGFAITGHPQSGFGAI
jgi:hypothetical protein